MRDVSPAPCLKVLEAGVEVVPLFSSVQDQVSGTRLVLSIVD